MGKFEKVTAALESLPQERREEIAEILETLFYGDLNPESGLSEEQIEDVRACLRDPGPLATDAEMKDFFSRFH